MSVKLAKWKCSLSNRQKGPWEMALTSVTTAIFVTASKPIQKHFFMTPVCNFRRQRKRAVKVEDIICTFLAACPSIRYRHCSELKWVRNASAFLPIPAIFASKTKLDNKLYTHLFYLHLWRDASRYAHWLVKHMFNFGLNDTYSRFS